MDGPAERVLAVALHHHLHQLVAHTLGLAFDASGFVRRSQVFGNVREHHTPAEMLDALDTPRAAQVARIAASPQRTACSGWHVFNEEIAAVVDSPPE